MSRGFYQHLIRGSSQLGKRGPGASEAGASVEGGDGMAHGMALTCRANEAKKAAYSTILPGAKCINAPGATAGALLLFLFPTSGGERPLGCRCGREAWRPWPCFVVEPWEAGRLGLYVAIGPLWRRSQCDLGRPLVFPPSLVLGMCRRRLSAGSALWLGVSGAGSTGANLAILRVWIRGLGVGLRSGMAG